MGEKAEKEQMLAQKRGTSIMIKMAEKAEEEKLPAKKGVQE